MPREPKFTPIKTEKGWCLNIPAKLSETGKRQRRYYETKSEAEGKAQQLDTRRRNYGQSAPALSPALEEQAVCAFRLLEKENLSISLVDVVAQYLERRKKSAASLPFSQAFDQFVSSKTRRPAYKIALDSLRKIAAPIHPKILRDITGAEIDALLADMGPAHRNQRLRELRAVWNYGMKKKWADENPILGLDFIQRQVAEPDVYTPEELSKLLAGAVAGRHELVPILAIAAFAGIRQHEILRMDWSNIDLKERSIDLEAHQTKKGRRRSATINDTLHAWLQWYIGQYGKQSGPLSAWSGIWSIRIPVRKLHKDTEVPLKPNGLRHSFASYHLAEHGEIDALVLALGHRGNATLLWEHYHRAVKKADAAKYWALTPRKVIKTKTPKNVVPMPVAA